MLKSIFILILLFFTSFPVCSQNLVLNPSFEETDCDAPIDNFFYPNLNWYNVTNSSPDSYSTSLGPGECFHSEPTDGQTPRTGTFMAGLWGSQIDSPTREYIQSRLTEPMIGDSIYCTEIYVLRAAFSPLAINRFGVNFSQDSLYNFSTSEVLSGGILLSNPVGEFLTDAEDWIQLNWEYEAEGGEEFITLGNFWEESELQYVDVEGTDTFPLAYYYVDDISVQKCSVTSVPGFDLNYSIGPNPCSDFLTLNIEYGPVDWSIISMDGRYLESGKSVAGGIIDLKNLPAAMYLFRLRDNKGGTSSVLIYKD